MCHGLTINGDHGTTLTPITQQRRHPRGLLHTGYDVRAGAPNGVKLPVHTGRTGRQGQRRQVVESETLDAADHPTSWVRFTGTGIIDHASHMRDYVYPVVVRAILAAFKGLDLEFQVKGADNVPKEGGVLVAFNHVAHVDFILGGYGAWKETGRLPRFMAKREVFDNAIAGPLMRGMHHISVDRAEGAQSMRDAVEYLQAGEMVGIFPEATISRSFEIKEIKSGATRIAAEAGVPLIPVAIWGSQLIMTKDHPKDLFGRGKTITLVIGEPMYFDGQDPEAETAALREKMIELHEEALAWHPAEEHPPGSWWLPASRGGSAPTPEVATQMDTVEKAARAARKAAKATKSGK